MSPWRCAGASPSRRVTAVCWCRERIRPEAYGAAAGGRRPSDTPTVRRGAASGCCRARTPVRLPAQNAQNLQIGRKYSGSPGGRMKSTTRIHYATRLEPVLQWLAARPDAAPDLYHLADLACLSPYHFHRVYRALMGETVNATMQRLRMHRASVDLAGNRPMQQVAQRAGYASQAAFNRAFSAVFGMPPGRYRHARSRPFNPQELGMYPTTIEQFSGASLATLAHQGDYQHIGATFDRLFMLASSRDLVGPDTRSFGVYYDDPAQVPASQLR